MMNSKIKGALAVAVALPLLGLAGTASASVISSTQTGSISSTDASSQYPGHAFQRFTGTRFMPRNAPLTIGGVVDLTNASSNSAIFIGLVDADFYDNSGDAQYNSISSTKGQGAVTYQSGAYAYFSPAIRGSSFNGRASVSDGNKAGDVAKGAGSLDGDLSINFDFTINPDGTLALTANGNPVQAGGVNEQLTYGDVKSRTGYNFTDYSADEFANGAYLSIEFIDDDGTASYDFTASQQVAGNDVPEPSEIGLLALGVLLIGGGLYSRRRNSPLIG